LGDWEELDLLALEDGSSSDDDDDDDMFNVDTQLGSPRIRRSTRNIATVKGE
jgi:hypothetical protein